MPFGGDQPISCPADHSDALALRTEAQHLFYLSHWYPPIGLVAPLGGWFSVTT